MFVKLCQQRCKIKHPLDINSLKINLSIIYVCACVSVCVCARVRAGVYVRAVVYGWV